MKERTLVKLSDRSPVEISEDDWPTVSTVSGALADETWYVLIARRKGDNYLISGHVSRKRNGTDREVQYEGLLCPSLPAAEQACLTVASLLDLPRTIGARLVQQFPAIGL